MKCKECGAHLPFGSYGHVRCEFCNAPNYVPVPGEKAEEEEKPQPVAPTPMSSEGKKGISIGLIVLVIISLVIVGVYLKGSSQSDSYYQDQGYVRSSPDTTSAPGYTPTTTPAPTTSPSTVPPTSIPSSALEGKDAIDLLPTVIPDYETRERQVDSKLECSSMARATYYADRDSRVNVVICEAKDSEEYLNRLYDDLSLEHGIYSVDFRDINLAKGINAKRAGLPDTEENVVFIFWTQDSFIFGVTAYSDPIWSGWSDIIAESVANRIIQIQ